MSAGPRTSARTRRRLPWRTLLMLPAGISLLAGLNAALMLLELPALFNIAAWSEVHGMVLALGFIGTLVALERAVALGKLAGYLSPLLIGIGSLLLLTSLPRNLGKLGLLLGMAGLIWVYIPLWRRQRDNAVSVQMLAAGLGTGAALLWLGGVDMNLLLPWLVAFVVLTIAGERIELARITMGAGAGRRLVQLSWAVTFGVVGSLLWPQWGSIAFGLSLLGLTAFLATNDVARRTIKATGATRFMAACMLAGYAWLSVAAITWCFGFPSTQARYDTVIHAVFLGFTMSMIIAHSSTILPAVLRRPLPYRKMMWAPAILLHAGLLLRVWIGDGLGYHGAWLVGSMINIIALLLFFALAILSVALGEVPSKTPKRQRPDESKPARGLGLGTRPGGLSLGLSTGPKGQPSPAQNPGLGIGTKPRSSTEALVPAKDAPDE